jgi:hypothetical protein
MSQQDMDLLLWLHAEAVWEARVASDAADDWCAKWEAAEASRRDWAAEADRLTEVVRALSGELGEAGFEHAAVTAALATVQPDLEFDYDEPPLCSCLTPDGAAVVLAGGLCLPLCAVHPEADR